MTRTDPVMAGSVHKSSWVASWTIYIHYHSYCCWLLYSESAGALIAPAVAPWFVGSFGWLVIYINCNKTAESINVVFGTRSTLSQSYSILAGGLGSS